MVESAMSSRPRQGSIMAPVAWTVGYGVHGEVPSGQTLLQAGAEGHLGRPAAIQVGTFTSEGGDLDRACSGGLSIRTVTVPCCSPVGSA